MNRILEELGKFGKGSDEVADLPLPGSSNSALAVKISPQERYKIWNHFFNLRKESGLYPVVTAIWSEASSDWRKAILNEEQFSRFYFEEEGSGETVLPRQMLAAVQAASIETVLNEHNRVYTEEAVDSIGWLIASSQRNFGRAPTEQDILSRMSSGEISDYFGLNEWFLRWQVKNIGLERLAEEDRTCMSWFEPTEPQLEQLILLPVIAGPHILAYLHWYGACNNLTPPSIKMLMIWQDLYGAEITAHYGTMLHMNVAAPPTDIESAFELATQIEAFAPCTTALSGVSLPELAIGLIGRKTWFLHERP